ncbi:hypothetical protein Q7P37_005682 [Cladosporium fusiforme]
MTSQPAHLVLVCCHATYKGGDPDDETSWILQDFQKSDPGTGKRGEHLTFLEHIQTAAAIVSHHPDALLLFSGGKTQSQIDQTEAESYQHVYDIKNKVTKETHESPKTGARTRVSTETHATDSFQNLLFSLLRFKRLTTSYPAKITIITHTFKSRRFLELHGPALKYPASSLRVLGINPPFTLNELDDVQRGELVRGYDLFMRDLYGNREPLSSKRRARGWVPDLNNDLADGLDGEVRRLLEWDGGENGKEIFGEKLPWESP